MNLARKLILSIITLVGLIACFSVSTYAWFKVNSEATVDGFEFEVNGGLGFMVSVDDTNYSNSLTTDQMKMTILRGYSDFYTIKNNKLYYGTSDENLELVTEEEINHKLKDIILLSPVTSKDGRKFFAKDKTQIEGVKTEYIEFDIYFKATSNNPHDKVAYDIYLDGDDSVQMDGTVIPKTSISSSPDDIELRDDMTIYDGTPNGKTLTPPESIRVYPSNALRLSAEDIIKGDESPIIYELTNEHDLGSYATDYDEKTDTLSTDAEKEENKRLYDSKFNAMFTYYNNLRDGSPLTPMYYGEKPETVRELTPESVITTVESASIARRVTFRLWLEGWDADCFDGLTKPINVRLLFNSTKRRQS